MLLLSRLRAGRDQAYHLARRTQDGRPGRAQHSHRAERRARGPGVLTQERTDPQVTGARYYHIISSPDFSFLQGTEALFHFTLRVYGAETSCIQYIIET